ncbi:4'-phosphopantetheinyl transferase superfamily protein [Candidatus Dependentiae bacterium]|nr:4'-phosphopantetheinyl transferase superfamily protein [Candidatus Dependentiae bacterium]
MPIIGVGIDAVQISRFEEWRQKSMKSLKRVLSEQEIQYCLQEPSKSAERFAVRFAAREALLKALQPLLICSLPLLALCRNLKISRQVSGMPEIQIDWSGLNGYIKKPGDVDVLIHSSFTHTSVCAHAIVVLERI